MLTNWKLDKKNYTPQNIADQHILEQKLAFYSTARYKYTFIYLINFTKRVSPDIRQHYIWVNKWVKWMMSCSKQIQNLIMWEIAMK